MTLRVDLFWYLLSSDTKRMYTQMIFCNHSTAGRPVLVLVVHDTKRMYTQKILYNHGTAGRPSK